MSDLKKTKNDLAWEKIFENDNLLKIIETHGLVEITSDRINQERESRLMAKFDHLVNLPQIFREHSLSILPISRNKYVIGHFETYAHKYKTLKFIQNILEHQVFYQVFAETLKSGEVPSIPEIEKIMAACNLGIKEKLFCVDRVQLEVGFSGFYRK